MENEQKQYELRSRSRSRSETPQTFSRTLTDNEGSEHGSTHQYDLRNKSRERSMTPGEVSSSRRSSSRSLPSTVIKARLKNIDPISEQKDDTLTDIASEKQAKTSEISVSVTKTTKKSERRSERQRVKRQLLSNGESEIYDDSLKTKSEMKERNKDNPIQKNMTSDYSSEEGDREDIPSRPGSSYEFYKSQGDYWNKFPKTDYTYSQASSCRYEVAPGVMAIPNMSRRSLHSDNTSFYGSQTSNSQSSKESFNEENNTMNANERRDLLDTVPQVLPHIRGSEAAGQSVIFKRTQLEQYSTRHQFIYDSSTDNQINERYETWAGRLLHSNNLNNNYRSAANVDSDTEFDEAVTKLHRQYRANSNQKFTKFTSLISTWLFATLHFFTFGKFKKREFSTSHYYRRSYGETKWDRLKRQVNNVTEHIYLLLVKVLLLDSWLLSRASSIRDRIQGRRSKLLWLVLLPLFLVIGYWLLPFIMSVIPLFSKHMQSILPQIKEKTSPVHIHSIDNVEDYSKSNQELINIVNLLINRVQKLETERAEQSDHLTNVTKILEELKRADSNMWRHYEEKIMNLEQVLENQNINEEKCRSEEFDYIKVEFQTLKQLYTELKTCCDTSSNTVNEEDIRKSADQVFASYFGKTFSKDDVVRIFQIMNSKIQQDDYQRTSESKTEPNKQSSLGVDDIRRIVLQILKIYDADKTGRVDYALESAGGQVISTRCTQRYNIHTRAFKILGLTLYYESNNPRTVIQGNTLQPGMCWAFQDFPGYLLIKLRSMIYVTGFTVEHAPRSNLPNEEMKSAPKKFNVWGLKSENDLEPVMFGEYEFSDSHESLQYFPIQNTSIIVPYEYVEMRIHSNHGQLEYTCLYRFRVHGNLA